MPELSRFYGIVVRMFFNDHPPPHFHANYGPDEALFAIETLSLIAGRIPARGDRARNRVGLSPSGGPDAGMEQGHKASSHQVESNRFHEPSSSRVRFTSIASRLVSGEIG